MSLGSAKGTARTAKEIGSCFAPHSVLREFSKSDSFRILAKEVIECNAARAWSNIAGKSPRRNAAPTVTGITGANRFHLLETPAPGYW